MEPVGAALGDGVDLAAGEIPLAHIERRYQHLELPHGLERQRAHSELAAGRAGAPAQAEEVVVGATVDHQVVVAVVGPGDRGTRHFRRRLDQVHEVPVEQGQPADGGIAHREARPGAVGGAQRIGRRGDLRQRQGFGRQLQGERQPLAERQLEILDRGRVSSRPAR